MSIDVLGSPRKRRRFADTMAAALRDAGETRPIRYDPAAFALRIGRGPDGESVHRLDRDYRLYGPLAAANRPVFLIMVAHRAAMVRGFAAARAAFPKALEGKLLALGGSSVVCLGPDPQADLITARGALFPQPVRVRRGAAHRCHGNAAEL